MGTSEDGCSDVGLLETSVEVLGEVWLEGKEND